jgi:hypothetical protein
MDTVINSQMLEDLCMQKLNWNLQRVANSSRADMVEALEIYNSLKSGGDISHKHQNLNIDIPLRSKHHSRQHSKISSPIIFTPQSKQHSKISSPIIFTSQTQQHSRQHSKQQSKISSPNISYTQSEMSKSTIQKHQNSILRHIKRIEKMKTTLQLQQTTKKDKIFVQTQIKNEQTLLEQVREKTKDIIIQLKTNLNSKNILLTMYEGLCDDNTENEELLKQDLSIVEDIKLSIKNMEDTKNRLSDF